MIAKKLSWKWILPVFVMFVFVACEEEDGLNSASFDYDALITDIENMTADEYTADLAELDLRGEEDTLIQRFRGKHKCFTFVFPVSIVFPDGSTLSVESAEDFRTAMREWKEANPDAESRPYIEMPFDVTMRDGTVVTVETEEDLEALKEECFENRPHIPRFKLCFDPVFPITVAYPDGTEVEVEDIESLKSLYREWKEANPDAENHPEIVFPIEIVTSDGETVSVESLDELKEKLKDCADQMKKRKKHKKNGGH